MSGSSTPPTPLSKYLDLRIGENDFDTSIDQCIDALVYRSHPQCNYT